MATDWSKLKVTELKSELKSRGLSIAGLKQELIDRLSEADAGQPDAAPEEIDEKVASEEAEPASVETQPEKKDEEPALSKAEPAAEAQASPETVLEEAAQAPAPVGNGDALHASEPAETSGADVQKRKRRSTTPPPSSKRARQEEEREDAVDYGTGEIDATVNKSNGAIDTATAVPMATPEKAQAAPTEDIEMNGEATHTSQDATQNGSARDVDMEDAPRPFEDAHDAHALKTEDNRMITPAIHPATSALYIRDFMRPLRIPQVEEYLAELATPADSAVDMDVIETFHLDQIRTHAFVVFKSLSAAARVRSSLHDRVWPDESNRKPLWVDFVPPEQVQDWIGREQDSGRDRSTRWEVTYDQTESGVTTTLVEISEEDARAAARPSNGAPIATSASQDAAPAYPNFESAPKGPRGSAPQMNPYGERTQAQPPLHYKPVSKELAETRVQNIRSFVSTEQNRDLGREINRYTFEEGDNFVDRGKEVFIGIRPPAREKRHQEQMRQAALGNYIGRGGYREDLPQFPVGGGGGGGYRGGRSGGYDSRDTWRRDGGGGDRRPRNWDSRDDRSYRQPDRNQGRYRDDPYRYRP